MAQTKQKNKKKGSKRYKIHYDRLIAQLIILCLLIFLFVWLVSLCSSDDQPLTEREIMTEAVQAGHRDAKRVLHTAPESMERYNALFEIRAREYDLRKNGFGHAADDYIEAARKCLKEHGIE